MALREEGLLEGLRFEEFEEEAEGFAEFENEMAYGLGAEDSDEFFWRLLPIARRIAPFTGRVGRVAALILGRIARSYAQIAGRVAGGTELAAVNLRAISCTS